MQESWKFHIDHKSDQSDYIIIKDLFKENQNEIGIFLSYYFKKDGAVVENAVLDGDVKTTSPGRGKFQVSFDLIFYNACLNIHDQNKDKIEIDYKMENDTIILTGPFWPERGQDEI